MARGRGVLSTFDPQPCKNRRRLFASYSPLRGDAQSALQGNWRQNLINAQQTFPAFRLQKKPWRVVEEVITQNIPRYSIQDVPSPAASKPQNLQQVLGFFAARQLGCLLNAVSHDLRERAQEVGCRFAVLLCLLGVSSMRDPDPRTLSLPKNACPCAPLPCQVLAAVASTWLWQSQARSQDPELAWLKETLNTARSLPTRQKPGPRIS